MHLFAFFCLTAALAVCLGAAVWACFTLWDGKSGSPAVPEWAQTFVFGLLTLSSVVLLTALAKRDFSFKYVAEYSDSLLPMFYTLTAFWAGQSGSFLFWLLMIGLFGFVWTFTSGYQSLHARTKGFYWLFFFLIQSVFLLLLIGPANPFIKLVPAPLEGNGLNPLLQHPGMIFHPPVLFMGYAGFTIPFCLALASSFSGEGVRWVVAGRRWFVLSWVYLSVGIILGGWWSYMELGWGGYWAWDPVENASLIPWLSSSALLHTAIIGRNRRALERTNLFLMGLTLALCFFGTYVVRSGVIDSLHAFGASGLGGPLLTLILATLTLSVLSMAAPSGNEQRSIGELFSRQGLMVVTALFLMLIGMVILMGTMWPVISLIWSPNPIGLGESFYNRVCLPLFAALSCILAWCTWLGWKKGFTSFRLALTTFGVWAGGSAMMWWAGMNRPLPLLAAGAALAAVFSMSVNLIRSATARKSVRNWGVALVHIGLAFMILGVAWSGPFKVEREFVLEPGRTAQLDGYSLVYRGVEEFSRSNMFVAEATLEVSRNGKVLGKLNPQRRLYRNFQQPFAEASILPGFGDEVYATLLSHTPDGAASFKVSINPLVNWIWIGGTLMCLAGVLSLFGRERFASVIHEAD